MAQGHGQLSASYWRLVRLRTTSTPLVAGAWLNQDFAAGTTIIKQGVTGDGIFTIKADTVESKQVAERKAGDYFGKNALLGDEVRNKHPLGCRRLAKSP